ncbi:MAG: glycosyltransferase [Sphingobacteriales bacterium]|nr:glycosyltransferase [Sphingobacteriales bacterium]
MYTLAPVIIFTYKRIGSLKLVLESLNKCALIERTEIIIFSDAAKGNGDEQEVSAVRNYLIGIESPNIKLNFSEENYGLAKSIIGGVTKILNQYHKVIVLEDDLTVSTNFLIYMNNALDHYQNNSNIFSIAGYSVPITAPDDYPYDVYFFLRASSWGWATWNDRWTTIDWEVNDYEEFIKNKDRIKAFNEGGSDMFNMLKKQMNGKINSWAIRWCYHQFRTKSLTVYPVVSKIKNIGFSEMATHSNVYNRYKTLLDTGNTLHFNFPSTAIVDQHFTVQFQHFYSIRTRFINKIRTLLYKVGFISNKND